jgi:hypothetical protein
MFQSSNIVQIIFVLLFSRFCFRNTTFYNKLFLHFLGKLINCKSINHCQNVNYHYLFIFISEI